MSSSLSEHLPLLASAPDGIKKLRGLILELAVRGKLVPQDPDDEPASELLKRIAAGRSRLELDGTIKKSKALLSVSKSDGPFVLPESWGWVRLGTVLEMINGRAFKPTDWLTSGLPIVRIQNLNKLAAPFNYCDPRTVDERHRLCSGDFLISWSGTPGTSFGAFIWERGDAALNQHIFRCLLVGDGFRKDFLKLAVNSQLEVLIAQAQGGVGLQHVTKGTLEALALPLPPLAEQHRIVAKVDELMALCDRLEAEQADSEIAHDRLVETLLSTLSQSSGADDLAANWQRLAEHFDTLFSTEPSIDALKQTILQLAVMGKLVSQDPTDEPASNLLKRVAAEKSRLVMNGTIKKDKSPAAVPIESPFELPRGWQRARLGQVCSKITDGEHATPRRASNGHYLLSARNVTNEGIILGDVDFVPEDEFERIRKRCDPNIGDVLISCSGSVGRVALVDKDDAYSMVRSAAMVRPVAGGVAPDFLARCLRSPPLQIEMSAKSRQSAQANLFLGAIASLCIPIPPLAEQHRIVAKVDELMALCDRLKADLVDSRSRQARLADTLIAAALEAA